jgi:DNA repair exonuclease SbcCD nuclease subunit
MTLRFIHTGDWQMGMTRRFLSEEAQARFSQARVDAIRRIGAVAKEEGAAFIIVAGDVFESNQVETRTVRRTLEALSEVPVPVYLLPGNHDPLDAGSVYRSPTFESKRPANVFVLDDSAPRTPTAGVEVVGAPWMTKQALHDPVESVVAGLEPSPTVPRVLVAHGQVRDALGGGGPAAIDVDKAEAAVTDKRISYLALGDRHSTTELGTSGRIYYSGSPEPTAHDEVDAGNVLVVELGPNGECTVRPRRVAAWRFVINSSELDGQSDVETLGRWLDSQADKEKCVVRLTLSGTISLSVDAALQGVLERHHDLFGAVEVTAQSDLIIRPDDDDFSDMALTGFAAEAVGELRATASGQGQQAQVARDALALLVRLAGNAGAGQ